MNSAKKNLCFWFFLILISIIPFNQIDGNNETSIIPINPEYFSLNVQEGDWREYNVSKLFNASQKNPIYIEEGQQHRVSINTVEELFLEVTLEIKLLNGSTIKAYQDKISRSELPPFNKYITTTNVTLLKQMLKSYNFLDYKIEKHELSIQWVRNSTTYPDLFGEDCSFIEEWNIDLKTGWLKYYKDNVIENGFLNREIVIETMRGKSSLTTNGGFSLFSVLLITIFYFRKKKKRKYS